MNRVTTYAFIAIATAVMLTASSAAAHHSFAMFDQSKKVTLQGTVKEFLWTNPHVFIQLLVKGSDGNQVEWSIEMTSPEHLARAGWRPGTLKSGEKITIVIHPLHDNKKGGEYLTGTGPNGPLLGAPPPGPGR
ncbi:MAG: DUF6152 family protein [Candidatus Acidiferrales bacterium]